MLNINYYVTIDDNGAEKYIMTIDVTVAEITSMTANEIGTEILEAIAQPPTQI